VLRQDLKEKVLWHHEWKRDFMVFLRNEHALFATCFSHADHPFSRRDRRYILLSVILMDFGLAIGVTYAFATIQLSDAAEFFVDYLISFFFGAMMSFMESILVSFAICSSGEKCPGCIRDCCNSCGSIVIFYAFFCAMVSFACSLGFIVAVSNEEGTEVFWQVFSLNFVLGLIQAWFLMDLIKMALQFRTAWKDAHPPPPGPEREEEEEKRASASFKLAQLCFCCCCCPLWALWQCCCASKKKDDPYDDGQGELGVNYREYLAWRAGEDIGDRTLPKSYQNLSTAALTRTMNAAGKKLNEAVHDQTEALQKKVDGVKSTTGKWKQKALKMQMGLSKKGKSEQDNVELVVGTADADDDSEAGAQ